MSVSSPHVLAIAKHLAIYVDKRGDDQFLHDAILWMSKHKEQYAVRRAISDLVDPDYLLYAIATDKPLKRNWTAG